VHESLDNTTLYLRDLPKDVVRNLKARAALRGMTLSALAGDILTRAAGDDASAALQPLEADMAWYGRQKPHLLRRYRGRHLAIMNRRVIDHDRDFDALARRVFLKIGVRPIFMPKCVDGERVIHLRSPRLGRR
jgi:plasmid stability protein